MTNESINTILHHVPFALLESPAKELLVSTHNRARYPHILRHMDVVIAVEPEGDQEIYTIAGQQNPGFRNFSSVRLSRLAIERLVMTQRGLLEHGQRSNDGVISSNSLFSYAAGETDEPWAVPENTERKDFILDHIPSEDIQPDVVYNLMDISRRNPELSIMGVNKVGPEPYNIPEPQVLTTPWANGPLTVMSIYTAQQLLSLPTLPYPRLGSV